MSWRNLWIFRDKLNFTIFVGGSATAGLLIFNRRNENLLDHPVIH
jgi:hypothetical protein